MSKGRVCDNCGEVVVTDDRGEDDEGVIHAWIRVGTLDDKLAGDACSRSCAIELLADDTPLSLAIEERLAGIAAVIRTLNGEEDDE